MHLLDFKFIDHGIDTKTPAGRFFFHVMASLAQMERELIIERTRAGLQAARHQGRVGDRKRQVTDSKIQAAKKLLASGTPPTIADMVDSQKDFINSSNLACLNRVRTGHSLDDTST